MPLPRLNKRALRRMLLCCICIAPLTPMAWAHGLPGGVELGMSPQQLQQAVAELKPVKRPAHLAGGLAGSWSGPSLDIAGVTLTPTYFFAESQLRRIEYLASAEAGNDSFDALLRWGRAAWGQETLSEDPAAMYAAWSDGEADAYLQWTRGAKRPQLRLVIKRRVLKDGGEL